MAKTLRRAEWQCLFEELIEEPGERERVARALGVHEVTPWRWGKGESKPLDKYIRKLPDLFPKRKRELLHLLRMEYPHLFPADESEMTQIPSGYYDQLLTNLSEKNDHGNEPFFSLSLTNLASQIRPHGETFVYLLGFSPTRRSLCSVASMRYSTPYNPLIQHHYLWIPSLVWAGCESVAGQAVLRKKPVVTQGEAAYPFLRRGQVAGCLWIVQPGQCQSEAPTWSETAQDMLNRYSRLLAIVFPDNEYTDQVDLEILPDQETQREVLTAYRLHVISQTLLLEAETLLVEKGASHAQQ